MREHDFNTQFVHDLRLKDVTAESVLPTLEKP